MKTPEQWDKEGVCYASAARKIQEDARESLLKALEEIATDCDDVSRDESISSAEIRAWRAVARRARNAIKNS